MAYVVQQQPQSFTFTPGSSRMLTSEYEIAMGRMIESSGYSHIVETKILSSLRRLKQKHKQQICKHLTEDQLLMLLVSFR